MPFAFLGGVLLIPFAFLFIPLPNNTLLRTGPRSYLRYRSRQAEYSTPQALAAIESQRGHQVARKEEDVDHLDGKMIGGRP
jgi:hypothetical protein